MANNDQQPLEDVSTEFPTVSWQQQYARAHKDELSPFQAIDFDLIEHANILEDNANAQTGRDQLPATDDVER